MIFLLSLKISVEQQQQPEVCLKLKELQQNKKYLEEDFKSNYCFFFSLKLYYLGNFRV